MANATISSKNIIVESSLTLDPTQLFSVEQALVLAQDYLQNFARKPDFIDKLSMVFGKEANFDFLKTEWQAGDFSVFPEIEIINAVNINGANGAFAATTNKIYLSQGFRLLRILVLYSSVTMLVLSFSLLVGLVIQVQRRLGLRAMLRRLIMRRSWCFPICFRKEIWGR